MIWLGNDFLISGLLRQVERADAGDDGGSCWRSSLWPHTQVTITITAVLWLIIKKHIQDDGGVVGEGGDVRGICG